MKLFTALSLLTCISTAALIPAIAQYGWAPGHSSHPDSYQRSYDLDLQQTRTLASINRARANGLLTAQQYNNMIRIFNGISQREALLAANGLTWRERRILSNQLSNLQRRVYMRTYPPHYGPRGW